MAADSELTLAALSCELCQTTLQCRTVFRYDDDESKGGRRLNSQVMDPTLGLLPPSPSPASTLNTAHPTPCTARRLGRSLRQDPFIQAIYNNALQTANDTHTPTDTTQRTVPTDMADDRHHKIPELQGANYAPCYLSIQTYAATIEASDHLTSNPPRPDDIQHLKTYENKQNRLLSALLSSVPMEILGLLLVPHETPTPYDLIQQIVARINRSTKEDHQFLKIEAESIELENAKIGEYQTHHLKVRQKWWKLGISTLRTKKRP